MAKSKKMVKVIVGKKVWEVTHKMAMTMVDLGKQKYKKENVNAIVAVENGNIISLQNDVFDNTEAFVKAIANWEHGGYKCHYITKKEKEVK